MSMNIGSGHRKLNPYKILCVILFAETDYITWNTPEVVTVKLGPLSRAIGIPNYHVRDHLRWLESNRFISDLVLTYGGANLRITLPVRVLSNA